MCGVAITNIKLYSIKRIINSYGFIVNSLIAFEKVNLRKELILDGGEPSFPTVFEKKLLNKAVKYRIEYINKLMTFSDFIGFPKKILNEKQINKINELLKCNIKIDEGFIILQTNSLRFDKSLILKHIIKNILF